LCVTWELLDEGLVSLSAHGLVFVVVPSVVEVDFQMFFHFKRDRLTKVEFLDDSKELAEFVSLLEALAEV
jgi:hypothetical protein